MFDQNLFIYSLSIHLVTLWSSGPVVCVTARNCIFHFLVQKLYNDMENRIENATKLGRVPKEATSKHKGFSHWDSYSSRRDHDTILQVCYIIIF